MLTPILFSSIFFFSFSPPLFDFSLLPPNWVNIINLKKKKQKDKEKQFFRQGWLVLGDTLASRCGERIQKGHLRTGVKPPRAGRPSCGGPSPSRRQLPAGERRLCRCLSSPVRWKGCDPSRGRCRYSTLKHDGACQDHPSAAANHSPGWPGISLLARESPPPRTAKYTLSPVRRCFPFEGSQLHRE